MGIGIPVVDDVIDAGGDIATSIIDKAIRTADDFSDFLGLPPMASEVYQEVKKLYEGPVKDFFNTEVGKVIARAFTTMAYYQLAPILGPQLASAVYATPGVLRGEKFDQAWVTEFLWRVTTTAGILAGMYADQLRIDAKQAIPAAAMPTVDKLQDAVSSVFKAVALLKAKFPDAAKLNVMTLDYAGIAREFDVRQDTLLQAVAIYTRNADALAAFCADAHTGDLLSC